MSTQYPYLPEGRTILYVPAGNSFMAAAKDCMEKNSTDRKQPTGAVIVKNGQIIGSGANKWRLHTDWQFRLHNRFCIRRLLHVKSGTKYYLCPGCASSEMHAETQAVQDALKRNADTTDADLYLWGHWWCCKPCWDSMIGGKIKNVYLVEDATEKFKR